MTELKEFKTSVNTVYATVYYDEEKNMIKDVWEGSFGNSDNFKAVLSYVASIIEEKKITKWLADLRRMEGSFDSSSGWIQTEIMPRVLQAGLLLEAVVIPRNIFSKLSTRDTIVKINKFELQQFDEYTKAEKWLESAIVAK